MPWDNYQLTLAATILAVCAFRPVCRSGPVSEEGVACQHSIATRKRRTAPGICTADKLTHHDDRHSPRHLARIRLSECLVRQGIENALSPKDWEGSDKLERDWTRELDRWLYWLILADSEKLKRTRENAYCCGILALTRHCLDFEAQLRHHSADWTPPDLSCTANWISCGRPHSSSAVPLGKVYPSPPYRPETQLTPARPLLHSLPLPHNSPQEQHTHLHQVPSLHHRPEFRGIEIHGA